MRPYPERRRFGHQPVVRMWRPDLPAFLRPRRRWPRRRWLEVREDHIVLSSISWINPGGGDWDAAANRSGEMIPPSGAWDRFQTPLLARAEEARAVRP